MNVLMPLQNRIYKVSLLALLLTTVGTILGGIWADQSWGRFWGWDPKENGALLIVLWIIWMQHGRVSGQLPTLAFTAAAAFLNVIVALAWFGVNLLSVGLHSYGFITGIATALALFCVFETALIGTLWKLNADQPDNIHRV
jgi:ABC-type transport system involved in cytochrome c biogenesis permease subunit